MSTPVFVKTPRNINNIFADAVTEERHGDTSVVTEHPVEVGTVIADHIYRNPSDLLLTYVWSAGSPQNSVGSSSFLSSLYQKFLSLKDSATLVAVVTGKRTYQNMAIVSLDVLTDWQSENILELRIGLREIIQATTQTVTLTPAAQQALPQLTAAPINQGQVSLQPGTNFNSSQTPPP